MATVQGVPKCSVPKACSLPPLAWVPDADAWVLLCAAAAAKSEVKVTFDPGPPLVISKIENV